MYSGQIRSTGPRYCPSIEDKVVRFADKERHQLFLEPEGRQTQEVYVNGISTSLPRDVQDELFRHIPGLERAEIMRYGYAVEYDFAPPEQILPSLETKLVAGLYFAGQLNGTTGYEEAAAQGLLAGANAALKLRSAEPLVLGRNDAYMGVLIDDLVTRGVDEPYRMFTSRAEYRLQLREDNADLRLTEQGRALGLVDDARWDAFNRKRDTVSRETERLKTTWVNPRILDQARAEALLGAPIEREYNLFDLVRRPGVSLAAVDALRRELALPAKADLPPREAPLEADIAEQVEIAAKYAGYIARQQEEVDRAQAHETLRLPPDLDYGRVYGLSKEVVQKLNQHRPETLGQAARISGITPAAISLLLVHLKKLRLTEAAA
jgi:tRNA uridine 5-carboxymethylaminomethyl modification enzyme